MFHVHKRYGPKQALTDVSLDIPKNEFLFLTGPSGAGKSTLLKLLLRFHDPMDGRIVADGVDLRDFNLATLREQIGIVSTTL